MNVPHYYSRRISSYELVEHKMRTSGNKVLREMFGSKEKKVTEKWTNNKALHDVYSSLNK
jgi:hypothetical protein